jgi:hypothetical protein
MLVGETGIGFVGKPCGRLLRLVRVFSKFGVVTGLVVVPLWRK